MCSEDSVAISHVQAVHRLIASFAACQEESAIQTRRVDVAGIGVFGPVLGTVDSRK